MGSIFRLDVGMLFEVYNLAGNLDGVARGVETPYAADTTDAVSGSTPKILPADSIGTDGADASNYHATCHIEAFQEDLALYARASLWTRRATTGDATEE